ncbi:hypothetical protein [Natrarchaeobaculum aegyptiacum]|uniref:Uncharacterized protein n=1 Tax=Natrarchaeobaculum aegyptiacum TaxID=745377 RepID=A0A2Z2HSE4_9EURY|nr:hypothetical protein [Natrarchaeobaculum aegyptiacum]ARS90022.1 hypothetical protein B1756_09970 [Natrarchaeobaculum aegyptiacum]
MIGAYTIGKKAATFGFKRYGVPGAVATGGAALVGYVIVKRAVRSATAADEDSLTAAIDAQSIQTAVDERGLEAVTDVGTLEQAIHPDELEKGVDVSDLQSSVDRERDALERDNGMGSTGADGY